MAYNIPEVPTNLINYSDNQKFLAALGEMIGKAYLEEYGGEYMEGVLAVADQPEYDFYETFVNSIGEYEIGDAIREYIEKHLYDEQYNFSY